MEKQDNTQDNTRLLRSYAATAGTGKYKTWDELDNQFPELSSYDKSILHSYAATAGTGKYKTWDELDSKFPELYQPLKKKEKTEGSEAPLQSNLEVPSINPPKSNIQKSVQQGISSAVSQTREKLDGVKVSVPLIKSETKPISIDHLDIYSDNKVNELIKSFTEEEYNDHIEEATKRYGVQKGIIENNIEERNRLLNRYVKEKYNLLDSKLLQEKKDHILSIASAYKDKIESDIKSGYDPTSFEETQYGIRRKMNTPILKIKDGKITEVVPQSVKGKYNPGNIQERITTPKQETESKIDLIDRAITTLPEDGIQYYVYDQPTIKQVKKKITLDTPVEERGETSVLMDVFGNIVDNAEPNTITIFGKNYQTDKVGAIGKGLLPERIEKFTPSEQNARDVFADILHSYSRQTNRTKVSNIGKIETQFYDKSKASFSKKHDQVQDMEFVESAFSNYYKNLALEYKGKVEQIESSDLPDEQKEQMIADLTFKHSRAEKYIQHLMVGYEMAVIKDKDTPSTINAYKIAEADYTKLEGIRKHRENVYNRMSWVEKRADDFVTGVEDGLLTIKDGMSGLYNMITGGEQSDETKRARLERAVRTEVNNGLTREFSNTLVGIGSIMLPAAGITKGMQLTGMSTVASSRVGIMASSYVMTAGNYYNDAMEKLKYMNNDSRYATSLLYANTSATVMAMAESIFPSTFILTGKGRAISENTLKRLLQPKGISDLARLTKKDVVNSALLSIYREGLKEVPEELASMTVEKGINHVTNNILEKDLFDDNISGEEIAKTAAFSALGMWSIGAPRGVYEMATAKKKIHPTQLLLEYDAAVNKSDILKRIETGIDAGRIGKDQGKAMKERLDLLEKNYKRAIVAGASSEGQVSVMMSILADNEELKTAIKQLDETNIVDVDQKVLLEKRLNQSQQALEDLFRNGKDYNEVYKDYSTDKYSGIIPKREAKENIKEDEVKKEYEIVEPLIPEDDTPRKKFLSSFFDLDGVLEKDKLSDALDNDTTLSENDRAEIRSLLQTEEGLKKIDEEANPWNRSDKKIEEGTFDSSTGLYEGEEVTPERLAELYLEYTVIDDYIGDLIRGYRVRAKDFEKYGDRKLIGEAIGKFWLNKNDTGLSLDTIVQEINGLLYGGEITEQDFIDYILENPYKNKYPKLNKESKQIASLFLDVTGVALNRNNAKKIVEKASQSKTVIKEKDNSVNNWVKSWMNNDTGEILFDEIDSYLSNDEKVNVETEWVGTPIETINTIKERIKTPEGRELLQKEIDEEMFTPSEETSLSPKDELIKSRLDKFKSTENVSDQEVEDSVDFSDLPLVPNAPKVVKATNRKEARKIAAAMIKDKKSSPATKRMAKWLPKIFRAIDRDINFYNDSETFNKEFEEKSGTIIEQGGVVYGFVDNNGTLHINMADVNPNLLTALIHEAIHTRLSDPVKVRKFANELKKLIQEINPELAESLDEFSAQYDKDDRDIEYLTEGIARIVSSKLAEKRTLLQKIADIINRLISGTHVIDLYETGDVESVIRGITKAFRSGTFIVPDKKNKVRPQKFLDRMEAQGHKWAKKKEKTPEQIARRHTDTYFKDKRFFQQRLGIRHDKFNNLSWDEVYNHFLKSLKGNVRPSKGKKKGITIDTIPPKEYEQAIINAQVKIQQGHGYNAVVKGMIEHYGFTPSLAKMIATQGMMTANMTIGEAVQLFWKNGLSISHVKHIAKERGWKEKIVGELFRDASKGFVTYLNTRQDITDYAAEILSSKSTQREFIADVMNRYGLSHKEATILFKQAFKTVFQNGTWNDLSKSQAIKKMVNQRARVTKERNKETEERRIKNNEVKKKLKAIRKAMGSKTTRVFAAQKPIIKELLRINPRFLDQKTFDEVFTPLVDKIDKMVKGAKVKFDKENEIHYVDNDGQDGMITNSEMEKVIKGIKETVDNNYRDHLIGLYGDKISFDPSNTLDEVLEKIRKHREENALTDDEKEELNIARRTALLNEAIDVIEEYKQAEKDGDLDQLHPDDKTLIEEILNSSPENLNDRDIIELINTLNNAVANQNADYAGALVETIRAADALQWLERQNTHQIEGTIGKIKKVYFSTSQMMEAIMNSTTQGAKFAAISGVQEIHAGYGRSRRRIFNEWIKPLKKILKSNPELKSTENVIARGIIAYVIQHNGDSNADFRKRVEVLMNDAIAKQESKKASLVKEGEMIERFIEKYIEPILKSDNPSQDFQSLMAAEMGGNWEIVQLAINTSSLFKESLDRTLRNYDNKMLSAWENYTPTATKTISKELKLDDMSYGEPGLDTKQAGTTIDRVKFSKMKKGRGLDLDFDSVVERKMMDSLYYIETIGARKRAEKIFNNALFLEKAGELASKTLMDKLIDSVKQHRNMMTGADDDVVRSITNLTKRIRDIGTANALGSVMQVLVQVPSVYVRAAINLAVNPKVHIYYGSIPSNMPDSFYSKGTILDRKEMEAGTKSDPVNQTIKKQVEQAESLIGKLLQAISKNSVTEAGGKTIDQFKKMALWTLQNSDYWIAKKTWGAYYTKYLVEEKGLKLNEIDWDKESKNPDTEASAYADQQIDRTQNISDFTKGSYLVQRGKNPVKDIIMNTIAPFSSFSFNSRATAMLNIQKLRQAKTWNKDVHESFFDLLGFLTEALVFNGIKVVMLGALSKYIAEEFVKFVVDDEDEELIGKMFPKRDIDEQILQVMSQAYLETTFGGFGSLVEGKARIGLNMAAGYVNKEYVEKDLLPVYNNDSSLGQLALLFGSGSVWVEQMIDAAPYIKQFVTGEIDKVVKRPTKDEPAVIEKRKLTADERKIAGIIAIDALARSFGITDSKLWTPAIRGLMRYENNVLSKKYGDKEYTIKTMRQGSKEEAESTGRTYRRSRTTRPSSNRRPRRTRKQNKR